MRVLDSLFLEGPKILHRFGLAMFKLSQKEILAQDTPEDLYVVLRQMPSKVPNDILIDVLFFFSFLIFIFIYLLFNRI